MSLKAILLMGGNSAGKTTVLDRARDRFSAIPCAKHDHCVGGPCKGSGIVWVHADGGKGLNGSLSEQFRTLMRVWADPNVSVLVIEGTRIYSTVFRCAVMAGVPRQVAIASLLQTHEVGCAHIRQRCEKRGKAYRPDFWEKEGGVQAQLFNTRYERAGRKFASERPDLVLDLQEFWISEDYRELPAVEQWMMKHATMEGSGG